MLDCIVTGWDWYAVGGDGDDCERHLGSVPLVDEEVDPVLVSPGHVEQVVVVIMDP